MDEAVGLRVQWQAACQPVFYQSYNQVSRVVPFGPGLLCLDGGRPALFSLEGVRLWKADRVGGVGLHPAVLSAERAALAGSSNTLKIMDASGQLLHTLALDADIETPLIPGAEERVYFGIGTYECEMVCADAKGDLLWSHRVAEDGGLTLASCIDIDQGLWVPTNTGLLRLDALSGEPRPLHKDAGGLSCLASPLVTRDGVWVVAAGSFPCAFVEMTRDGRMVRETPLPDLHRAQLFSLPDGSFWVVGTTAWSAGLEPRDRVHAIRLSPSGQRLAAIEWPGHLSVDATVGQDGALWVGTYSDEGGDHGELHLLSPGGRELVNWSPDDPSRGFGAPLCIDADSIIVPTTGGLLCIRIAGW